MSEKSSVLELFSANETIFGRSSKVRISERNIKFTLVFHSEQKYLQDAKQIKGTNKRAKNKVTLVFHSCVLFVWLGNWAGRLQRWDGRKQKKREITLRKVYLPFNKYTSFTLSPASHLSNPDR